MVITSQSHILTGLFISFSAIAANAREYDPPVIHNCPPVIREKPDFSGNSQQVVEWDVPTASDPSGPVEVIHQPPSSSKPVQVGGGPESVYYVFRDTNNNIALCSILISVEGK